MKIELENIRGGLYAAVYKNERRGISFNCNDIKLALENDYLEERSLQGQLHLLQQEWNNEPDFQASYKKQKEYHINRIATLIKKELYKDPILVYKDINAEVKYLDGGHRVWAAKCRGEQEIEAIIIDVEKQLSPDEKDKLWKKISELKGNSLEALKALSIKHYL